MTTNVSSVRDGFDQARSALRAYEARVGVYRQLASTHLIDDHHIVSVHINDTFRLDRAGVTAFADDGSRVDSLMVYLDEPGDTIAATDAFAAGSTGLDIHVGSDLADAADNDGWICDMRVLREYDPDADRRATQRICLLAHLRDMLSVGDARALLFSEDLKGADRMPDNCTDTT